MIDLPDDLCLAIFSFLELEDILRIRTVNKACLRVSQAAALWRRLLREQMVRRNLPVPGLRGITADGLSGTELERLLRRALELQRNWRSPYPVAKAVTTLKAQDPGRIIFLEFLKRPGCSWLLSVSAFAESPHRRRYTIECWEVADTPKCIARRDSHQFVSIAANQSYSPTQNYADVAIQAPFITAYAIKPSPDDPEAGFQPIAQFPEREERLHFFWGTNILSSAMQEDGRLMAWDTRRPRSSTELRSRGLSAGQPTPPTLASTAYGGYIFIVRQASCELYVLPSADLGGAGASTESRLIEPLSEHLWPWRVEAVVLSPLTSPETKQPGLSYSRPPTICMLIRFQSGFPWPINLLHQFDLLPNPQYEEAFAKAVSPHNLPYQFPPDGREMIAAPLRLFAQSDMALGSHGTAIWFDSHTEDHFDHADRGQRLASRARTVVSRGRQADEDTEQDSSEQVVSTIEASVMGWNETDRWVKVAVDEEEGRIALGHMNGSEVTLLSFT